MFLSIGGLEILAALACGAPAATLSFLGHPASRPLSILSLAITVASVLTPADLLSTLVIAAALLLAFLLGRRMAFSGRSAPT